MRIILMAIVLLLFQGTDVWRIAANDGPSPRYVNQIVSTGESLLLFGGKHSDSDGFDDLWEWKEGQWQLLGNGASKRWDHSCVYMGNRNQLMLFGGRAFRETGGEEERVDLNESWVYANEEWERLAIDGPGARSSHGMAYLAEKQQVTLFGGRNGRDLLGDTWTFDGEAWSQLQIDGPSNRYGHAMAYDLASKRVYLFGGFDGDRLLDDWWAFDGETWKEIEVSVKPAARMAHAMQFDQEGNGVLFGGWDDSNQVSNELWVWSNGAWEQRSTENAPQARLSCALGYDAMNDELILFGGSTGFGEGFLSETWALSLQ